MSQQRQIPFNSYKRTPLTGPFHGRYAMPAPATTSDFLEICRKSGVVDEGSLSSISGHTAATPMTAAKALIRTGAITKFQAGQLLAGKYKGLRFDRLKILDRIGSGGMGTVFLCEHLGLRKQVAVKVLPPDQAGDEGVRERFFREARAAAALDHPNIVRVHDMNSSGGVHYIVMEFVEGQDLQSILNKYGPIPHSRACGYIAQAALGLQHAFEKGLVHRDIKPANLLVDKEGVVKILDLGLARFKDDEKEDNLTARFDKGAVLGTADYMAPEQIMASSEVDIRADIYSLGVTLYTVINGKPPFSGSCTQKLMGHTTQKATSLTEIRREVPKSLSVIVDKMMAKDPAHRFQTPAEVVDALTPWLETDTVPLDGPQTRKMAGSGLTRRRKLAAKKSRTPLIIAAAAISAVVFGGLGIWAFTGEDKPDQAVAANPNAATPPVNPGQGPKQPAPPALTPPKVDPPIVVARDEAKLIYEIDFSKVSAFTARYDNKSRVSLDGVHPTGWSSQSWRPGATADVGSHDHNGERGVIMRTNHGDGGSAELHTVWNQSPFKLIPGRRYVLRTEYANVGTQNGRIEVRFDAERAPAKNNVSLRPTRGEWQTADLRFSAPEHGAANTYYTHSAAVYPDYLVVRSLQVFEFPAETAPAATTNEQIVSHTDFGAGPRFHGTLANPGGRMMKEGALPPGWNAFVWRPESAGDVAQEEFQGKKALALRTTTSDKACAELTSNHGSKKTVVKAGRRYRVDLEYAAPANEGGRLDLRLDDMSKPGESQIRLNPTGNAWKSVSLEYTIPADADRVFAAYISNYAIGQDKPLFVKSVTLTEIAGGQSPVAGVNGTTVYHLDLANKPAGRARAGRNGGGDKLADGFVPHTWEPETTVEVAIENVAGSKSLTLRTTAGKPAAMLFGPYFKCENDHLYRIDVEYRLGGTAPAGIKIDESQVRGRHLRNLDPTGAAWATASVTFWCGANSNPGKVEIGYGGTDTLAIRKFDVVDLGISPPPSETLFKSVFAGLTPVRVKLRGRDVLESNGTVPAGFQAYAWDAASVMEFAVEQSATHRVMALRNLDGRETSMLFLPDVAVRPGITYWLNLEFMCSATNAAVARLVATGGKVRDLSEIPGTKGEWRAIHIPFRLYDTERDKVRLELHAKGRGPTQGLYIRSATVTIAGAAAAPTATPAAQAEAYQLNLANVKPFAKRYKKDAIVEAQGEADLPAPWAAHTTDAGTLGDVYIDVVGQHPVLGIRNHEGPPSVRVYSKSDLLTLKSGKKYVLKLWYQSEPNGKGWFSLTAAGKELNRTLLPTATGDWKEIETTITAPAAGGLTMAIGCDSVGSESAVFIRAIDIRELP